MWLLLKLLYQNEIDNHRNSFEQYVQRKKKLIFTHLNINESECVLDYSITLKKFQFLTYIRFTVRWQTSRSGPVLIEYDNVSFKETIIFVKCECKCVIVRFCNILEF